MTPKQAAETVGMWLIGVDPLQPNSRLQRRALNLFGGWIARNVAAAYNPTTERAP